MSEASPLPHSFQFTQSKLQDYVDCPRRFQLRHVLMQPWPALIVGSPTEMERQIERGSDFHRLTHQYFLGLDPKVLAASIDDPILLDWWQTFLEHPPTGLPDAARASEVVRAVPLAGYRLLAKFDLLAAEPGKRLVIVDWKTGKRPPSRSALARRMQTLVYRYLAAEPGAGLTARYTPRPEHVELVYWFAQSGGGIERFAYDADEHASTRMYLTGLIKEIVGQRGPVWPLTPDRRPCRFCQYRSLCDRGVKPGFLEELEEDLEPPEFDIELEQIAEIEF
jgi:CRISPR/Cas system-associated exonuclease Cas4 (RecB family)